MPDFLKPSKLNTSLSTTPLNLPDPLKGTMGDRGFNKAMGLLYGDSFSGFNNKTKNLLLNTWNTNPNFVLNAINLRYSSTNAANQKMLQLTNNLSLQSNNFDSNDFNTSLKTYGINWNSVESVQNWLNKNTNAGLTTDNMYGKRTLAAIENLINNNGRNGIPLLTNNELLRFKDFLKRTSFVLDKAAVILNPPNNLNAAQMYEKPINNQGIGNTYTGEDLAYTQPIYQKETGSNLFLSSYANGKGKFTLGKVNSEDEFNMAFDLWYGNKPSWINRPIFRKSDYDIARENMLNKYLTYYGLNPEFKKQGGQIIKHQQGGQMLNLEELQKAFLAFLIQDAQAQGMQIQSEQDLQAYVQQLGEEGLAAKLLEFMQKMLGGLMAKLGAKLNYIKKLKGTCPEGEELSYFMDGGKVCKKCMKAQKGVKTEKKQNAVLEFKLKRKPHYDEHEHAVLIEKYLKGKIKQNSPEHERLAELNRNSGHHDDGWNPKKDKKRK